MIRNSLLFCIGMLLVCQIGCVQRRLLIRSEPDGALVTIDDRPVGNTPYSASFVYYGTRKLKLEKDGFETIDVKERIKPPWYQVPPLSFFSDNFAFREIRDTRAVDFKLVPKSQTNEDHLIQRGTQLRQDVWRDTIVPPDGR